MFQHSIVVGACILLTTLSGTRATGGMPPCTGADCIKPYHAYYTQNNCVQELRPPQRDCRWVSGMDRRLDEIIYGGRIAAYRLQWFSGAWSGWFVPGFNDIDPKYNMYSVKCSLPFPANGIRRTWAYFNDHYHHIVICYSPVKCMPYTSYGPVKGVFPDPYVTGIRDIRAGVFSGQVDLANVDEVQQLKDGARVDTLLDQSLVDANRDLGQEVDPNAGVAQADG